MGDLLQRTTARLVRVDRYCGCSGCRRWCDCSCRRADAFSTFHAAPASAARVTTVVNAHAGHWRKSILSLACLSQYSQVHVLDFIRTIFLRQALLSLCSVLASHNTHIRLSQRCVEK